MSAADDATLLRAAAAFALLALRMLPLAWIAPWTSERSLPLLARVATALVLALCLWPVAQPLAALPPSPLHFAALAARELAIGLVYAVALSLPLRAFEWAGLMTGRFAGVGHDRDAPYARLQLLFAVAAFFAIGGHRVAIAALAESVALRPVGLLVPAADVSGLALSSVRLLAEAYALALLLALPVAVALALAELAFAWAARAASAGAGLLVPAGEVRSVLALLVVCMSAAVALSALPSAIARGLRAAAQLITGL